MADNRTISPQAELITLNASSFLFNEATQQLFALNPVAAYIWTCVEDGFDVGRTADAVARDFGISAAAARAHVRQMIDEWAEARMFSGADDQPAVAAPSPQRSGDAAPKGEPVMRAAGLRFCSIRYFQVLSQCFEARFTSPDAEARVLDVLGRLEIRDPPDERLMVDVITGREGTTVAAGPSRGTRCRGLDEVAPALKALMTDLTIEAEPHTLAFHAGAVTNGAHALLLPAAGGSGKSTLTAALLHAGFGYLSDDIVLLDQPSHRVRGVPLPLCIKAAGSTALAPLYPELAEARLHLRADDQRVRYLSPRAGSWSHDAAREHHPVRWIVFPRYDPERPSALAPIDGGRALLQLLPQAAAGMRLDKRNVVELGAWIETVACYELRVATLPTALDALRTLDGLWLPGAP